MKKLPPPGRRRRLALRNAVIALALLFFLWIATGCLAPARMMAVRMIERSCLMPPGELLAMVGERSDYTSWAVLRAQDGRVEFVDLIHPGASSGQNPFFRTEDSWAYLHVEEPQNGYAMYAPLFLHGAILVFDDPAVDRVEMDIPLSGKPMETLRGENLGYGVFRVAATTVESEEMQERLENDAFAALRAYDADGNLLFAHMQTG